MQILQKLGAIFLSIIGIIVLAVVFFNPNKGWVGPVDDVQEVARVVAEFGQKLKNVSLQNETSVREEIKTNYAEYLSPELLELWMSDPQGALGRKVSSPWPKKIEISSSEKKSDDTYEVKGDVIEVSSEGGGINETPTETSRQAITLVVKNINGRWLISGILTGPVNGVGDNWILSEPNVQGTQFMYPDPLSTTYVSAQEWPPIVRLTAGEFECKEGVQIDDDVISKNYKKKVIVGDREYCKMTFSEGAAGSTYTTYEYSIRQGDFIAHADFTLRFVQCANYNEPEQIVCKTEQAGFDVDVLADKIISSIRMI